MISNERFHECVTLWSCLTLQSFYFFNALFYTSFFKKSNIACDFFFSNLELFGEHSIDFWKVS